MNALIDAENRVMSKTYMRVVGLMALFLAMTGFIMVSSASMDTAAHENGNAFFYALRHFIFLLLATMAGVAVFQVPLSSWQRHSGSLLLFSYALLLVVLIPGVGRTVNGSTRWIPMGVFAVQVSEVVKICVLCYVAGYLVRRRDEVRTRFLGFIKPVIVLSLMVALLLKEPDFGAVVVIMATVLFLLFLAGVRFSQFMLVVIASTGAGAMMIMTSEYRMKRLMAYSDPWADQYSSGYQLVQSLIAFGRGDLTGVGLGNSVQKLLYLPEAHTDFVFAVIAEEFGLLGSIVVISAFLALVLSGMFIARRAERVGHLFGAYLAYGISIMIGLQSMINVGVASGMLPTKGLTLPLVSYGGSSLLMSGIAVALLLRVDFEMRHLLSTDPSLRRKLSAEENKLE